MNIDGKDIIVKLDKYGNVVATTDTDNKYVLCDKKLMANIDYQFSYHLRNR